MNELAGIWWKIKKDYRKAVDDLGDQRGYSDGDKQFVYAVGKGLVLLGAFGGLCLLKGATVHGSKKLARKMFS